MAPEWNGVEAVRPSVRVFVASFNTVASTELCIRTMREFAGHPFELTVGDAGSRDGSLEMLRSFEHDGWLSLEVVSHGRLHAEWLDRWLRSCTETYAIFVDSDVEFRKHGWLAELVRTARATGAALVYTEMLPEERGWFNPKLAHRVRLAARPAPWLFLAKTVESARLEASFAERNDVTDDFPEGVVTEDVGGVVFRAARDEGLQWHVMPRGYRRSYRHYSGLSWIPVEGERGEKKARDLRLVVSRLGYWRFRQDGRVLRGRTLAAAVEARATAEGMLLMTRKLRQPIRVMRRLRRLASRREDTPYD